MNHKANASSSVHDLVKCACRQLAAGVVVSHVLVQLAAAQPAQLRELPPDLAAIRAAQAELAARQDVVIGFLDEATRSLSRVDGVPFEFRAEAIETEHDLIALLERLYPYYGFSGTETLEFINTVTGFGTIQYLFRQHIAGIPTSQLFTIHVDQQSKRIQRLNLWLHMDRDLARVPAMSEQEAIDVALCFAGRAPDKQREEYIADGRHELDVVYQNWQDNALIPVWHVRLESAVADANVEGLAIMPGGVVSRDSRSSHEDPKLPFLCADPAAVPEWVRAQ